MNTLDPLLHAVLANPEYDIVRLVYADALEEAGDGEYARFIRLQVGGRPTAFPDTLAEQLRGKKPVVVNIGRDYRVVGNMNGIDVEYVVRRGFVSSVRCSLAAWSGRICELCRGRGMNDYYSDIDGRGIMSLPCTACHGTRRTPGHGAEIVARHPVERVEFTDAVIHPSGGNDTYYVGGLGMWPREEWSRLENHRSRSSALSALSAAAIRWARAEAVRRGLVPDVWSKT